MEFQEFQLGGLSLAPVNNSCIALLPKEQSDSQSTNNSGSFQKVVVGDSSGKVICFTAKNPNVEIAWKVDLGSAVSCLCLGGAINAKDKVFVSFGSSVAGINRKGKQFFSFDTNLTERISRIQVDKNNLYVVAGHIYVHYVEAAEKSFYLCPAMINDFVALHSDGTEEMKAVLACQDRCFRVLSGSNVSYEIGLESIPTVMLPVASEDNRFIYGTNDGMVTQVCLGQVNSEISTDWAAAKPRDARRVTALHFACGNNGKSGQNVYISREPGVLDVCSVRSGRIETLGSFHGNEILTGIAYGSIWSTGESVVFSTYSGRVGSLETRLSFKQGDLQNQIAALKSECDQLEKDVNQAKEKLVRLPKPGAHFSVPIPKFALVDSLTYSPTEATYILSVYCDIPILNIALQSEFAIDLSQDSEVSILPSKSGSGGMRAIYQGSDSLRAEIRLHPIEGQTGVLNASILIRTNPVLCLHRQYQVKPLASYQRSISKSSEAILHSMSTLGNFSIAEINAWISLCLQEVPEKPPNNSDVSYFYRSSFLNTELYCFLKKGSAEFQSDSINTLMVLKDFIAKEASARSRKLEIKVEVDSNAMNSLVGRIHEKLSYQHYIVKKIKLIEAITELQIQEPDLSCLASDLVELWTNRSRIESEFRLQPQVFERILRYLKNTAISYHAANGKTIAPSKIEKLLQLASDAHHMTVKQLIDEFQG